MSILHRCLWLILFAPCLASGQGAEVKTDEVRARLVAHAPDGVSPGKPLWLGLLIQHAPQWHTYWKNPGDSGLATTLSWELPAGTSAGAIEWPTPKRLPIGPLRQLRLRGHACCWRCRVTVAADFPRAVARREAACRLAGLQGACAFRNPASSACACRPRRAPSAHEAHFARARAACRAPCRPARCGRRSTRRRSLSDIAGLPADLRGKAVHFFAGDAGVIDHAAPLAQRWDGERLLLRVPLSAQRSDSPETMHAVVVGSRGHARRSRCASP